MRKSLLFPVCALLLAGCASTDASKKSKTGTVWRDQANGIQVFVDAPPGGIKRVIGVVYADAHDEREAIDALTQEANRLRADAIYGIEEDMTMPGERRSRGTPGSGFPDGNPKTGGNDSLFGDYSSERHVRTWRATAVVLEPAAPKERTGEEEGDDASGEVEDDTQSGTSAGSDTDTDADPETEDTPDPE